MFMLCEKGEIENRYDDYVFERKFDGERCMLFFKVKKDDQIQYTEQFIVKNRDMNDKTEQFFELMDIRFFKEVNDIVLDCEVCVFKNGKSDFNSLQRRSHTENRFKIKFLGKHLPIKAVVFDILFLNGMDLRNRSFMERRDILESVLKENEYYEISRIYEDKLKLWNYVKKNELEGIIAKKKDSPYLDKRCSYWVKIKNFKEIVLRADGYETSPKGIVLLSGNHRVALNGGLSTKVKKVIEERGYVDFECQYLEKTKAGMYRQPTFSKVVER